MDQPRVLPARNAFSLIVQIREPNLSAGMQRLNGLFGAWFNDLYGRRGHVFEGRFRSWPIETDEYFARAINYVRPSDESFVLCFVMIRSPSDSLRDLIYITVLRVFQQDPDRGLARGLTLLGGYPAVGFQHVEARLRRGAVR